MKLRSLATSLLLALVLAFTFAPAVPEQSAQTDNDWEKILFHVDDAAYARWALMLAGSYLADRPGARIVFVTYGPGIDFLLKSAEDGRGEPYAGRIGRLIDKGVEFRVCAATLDARRISPKQLLDATVVVPSGISEIARLQLREGYAYLKP